MSPIYGTGAVIIAFIAGCLLGAGVSVFLWLRGEYDEAGRAMGSYDDLLAACRAARDAITYESEEDADVGPWELPMNVAIKIDAAIARAEGKP